MKIKLESDLPLTSDEFKSAIDIILEECERLGVTIKEAECDLHFVDENGEKIELSSGKKRKYQKTFRFTVHEEEETKGKEEKEEDIKNENKSNDNFFVKTNSHILGNTERIELMKFKD